MTSSHERQFTIENNVLKGEEVSYPNDYDSLGEFILANMERNLDAVGQIDASTGEEHTFGMMRERSVGCALWMRSQGLRPGDVVVVCSRNHPDVAIPCFATLYLGAVLNPWNVEEPADFLYQMTITKPKMMFVSEEVATSALEASEKVEFDVKIIVFGRLPGCLEFDSVINERNIDEVKKFRCPPIKSLSETALIVFSSGTTGLSKAIAITHEVFIAQFYQVKEFGMAGNFCLVFTPNDWAIGLYIMFWGTLLNVRLIMVPAPFEENLACALIEKYQATWIFLSPSMIISLLKYDAVDRHDLSSVAKVYFTGARVAVATYEALAEILPKADIISLYSLVEFGGVALRTLASPPGSCGQIMENTQLKVIDVDTGRILGPNQKGELFVKSNFVKNFYHHPNSQEAGEILDAEGWMHSGDFGYYDESGEVFVLDRLKDAIRLADFDLSSAEIESVILSHPGVKDVAVVGQPRPQEDDALLAFVVRAKDFSDTDKQVTETDIVDLVASKVPDSRKHLGAGVRFIDQIPRTASGKIRRLVLRDMARAMVTI